MQKLEGNLVVFPLRNKKRSAIYNRADAELSELDKELRVIDQATRALAERKRGVLVRYRQRLRRQLGSAAAAAAGILPMI